MFISEAVNEEISIDIQQYNRDLQLDRQSITEMAHKRMNLKVI